VNSSSSSNHNSSTNRLVSDEPSLIAPAYSFNAAIAVAV
jgi:hypothetical protein